MNGTKEIKRKGKPIGVRPRKTKSLTNVRNDADDVGTARKLPTLKQQIIIAWMNKASILALVPSQKKYKEAQLEYVISLSEKMGAQFPQDVLDCAIAKKDIATLLRSEGDDRGNAKT